MPSNLYEQDLLDITVPFEFELYINLIRLSREIDIKNTKMLLQYISEVDSCKYTRIIRSLFYFYLSTGDIDFLNELVVISRDSNIFSSELAIEILKYEQHVLKHNCFKNILSFASLLLSMGSSYSENIISLIVRYIGHYNNCSLYEWSHKLLVNMLEENNEWFAIHDNILVPMSYSLLRAHSELKSISESDNNSISFLVKHFTDGFCSSYNYELLFASLTLAGKSEAACKFLKENIQVEQNSPPPYSSSHILKARITHTLEREISFILENMNEEFYLHLNFILSGKIHEERLVDLIRYLVCFSDETCQTYKSNIILRSKLIIYLLKYLKSHHTIASAKISIFFDWIFHKPILETKCNYEIGALLLMKSDDSSYLSKIFAEFIWMSVNYAYPCLMPFFSQNVQKSISFCTNHNWIQISRIPSQLDQLIFSSDSSHENTSLMKPESNDRSILKDFSSDTILLQKAKYFARKASILSLHAPQFSNQALVGLKEHFDRIVQSELQSSNMKEYNEIYSLLNSINKNP